jgi:hypothetical protein
MNEIIKKFPDMVPEAKSYFMDKYFQIDVQNFDEIQNTPYFG